MDMAWHFRKTLGELNRDMDDREFLDWIAYGKIRAEDAEK